MSENSVNGTVIGTLSAADSDAGDACTYVLLDDAGGRFVIEGDRLAVANGTLLDFESQTSHEITVRAIDAAGEALEKKFAIALTDVYEPPLLINPIATQQAIEDIPFTFQFPANTFIDGDGEPLVYSASLTDGVPLPNWLTFDPATRTFSGTPLNSDVGTIAVEIKAADSKGIAAKDSFDLIAGNANDAPVLTNAIPDRNVTEDAAFTFQFAANTFTDIDIGDTLTYTATLTNGLPLPNWLSFQPDTRTFSSTPLNSDVGTISVEVKADDGNGGTAIATFNLTVANVNDAPNFTTAPVITGTQDILYTYNIAATDPDTGDLLTITAPNLPAWLTLTDSGNGTATLTGTPTNEEVGSHAIALRVSDGSANVDQIFTVTVANVNDAPQLDLNGVANGIDYTAAFHTGKGAVAIVDSANLSVIDIDNPILTGATVTIVNPLDGISEILAATTAGNITASYSAGVLTLSGTDTLANYQQVLRSLTYNNTAANPNLTNRTIQLTVTDGTDSSSVATTTLSVNPSADLELSATASNSTPNIGDILTYTLTLKNQGNLDATNIQISDSLPNWLNGMTVTPAAGTYDSNTGVWSIANLASGTTTALTISGTVARWGTLPYRAQVTAVDQADPDSTPNNYLETEDDFALVQTNLPVPAAIALSDITVGKGGFVLYGIDAQDMTTDHVTIIVLSSAGDFNGDGFDDLLIGASGGDGATNNQSNVGESYVVFGGQNFNTSFNLAALNGTNGLTLYGVSNYEESGISVSTAGDVNNDGFDDLIVGAPWINAGKSYVVFGGNSSNATLDLSALNGTNGFALYGVDGGDISGRFVSNAGDVNGDGFDDLLVGAPHANSIGNAKSWAGDSYVVFGGASFGASLNLSTLNGSNGFTLYGVDGDDRFGASVSSAGDVNGDGFDDVIVGAFTSSGAGNTKSSAGESYVVFGKNNFDAALDLSTLNGSNGFTLYGIDAGDRSGAWVRSAGDVNGDGFGDLIVGALYGDGAGNTKNNSGESYVIFGGNSFNASLNLSALNGTNGFTLYGVDPGDECGMRVSGAGDVNGDGFDDLIVGAYYGDGAGNSKTNSGESYVIFGGSAFNASLDLSTLDGTNGFTLYGIDADDLSSHEISSAGDVNGDGFDDLMVGAPGGDGTDNAKSNSGETYVVYGGDFTSAVTQHGGIGQDLLAGTAAADVLLAAQGDDTLVGGGGADVLKGGTGDDVLSVGDLNFRRVDGGSGEDVLLLAGTGLSLDLTAIADTRLQNIEMINLNGGSNSLNLTGLEVLHLSDSTNRLIVDGVSGNSLTASGGWISGGTSGGYNIYSLKGAVLWVDTDIAQSVT